MKRLGICNCAVRAGIVGTICIVGLTARFGVVATSKSDVVVNGIDKPRPLTARQRKLYALINEPDDETPSTPRVVDAFKRGARHGAPLKPSPQSGTSESLAKEASIALANKEYERASRLFRKAILLNGDDAGAAYNPGIVYYSGDAALDHGRRQAFAMLADRPQMSAFLSTPMTCGNGQFSSIRPESMEVTSIGLPLRQATQNSAQTILPL